MTAARVVSCAPHNAWHMDDTKLSVPGAGRRALSAFIWPLLKWPAPQERAYVVTNRCLSGIFL